ncbi:MAG: PQQ-binding-like beta-propeller repeat protein [Armatimonadia bacterium]
MMTMRVVSLVVLAAMSLGVAWAEEPPMLLNGFETTAGLSMTFDAKLPDSKLSLNVDPAYVSEGKSSLLMQSASPKDATGNSYVGVTFKLNKAVSLKGRALVLDVWTAEPGKMKALYVRGFDAANKCALSWQTWNWGGAVGKKTEVQLIPGMSLGGYMWEPSMAVSPDRETISRIEIIFGVSDRSVPYGAYLDNVRVIPCEVKSFMDVNKARPRCPETALVRDGQASAAIVCPSEPAWRTVAGELQSALTKKLGVSFAVKSAEELSDEDLTKTNAILLGTVVNNRRVLPLYSHLQTYADDLYPGPEGYVVQSIHDPWGTRNNVLLIGASTPAGAREGMTELLAAIPTTGTVGPVFKVKLTGIAKERFGSVLTREPDAAYIKSQQAAAEKALAEGGHTGLFSQIASVGSLYAQTHKDGYATLFAWLAKRAAEYHDTNPGTYGGPWGMDSDFPSSKVIPLWAVTEQSPALSDEDRLEVTKVLFRWISDVCPVETPSAKNENVRFNHGTHPALGCLFAGQYFTRYYDAAEARTWLDLADGCFQFQAKASKPNEDCNGYQWLTLYHMMTYALAKPDFTLFENGNARRSADFGILCMDNLGYSVTYGDTGAYVGWWSEMPFLMGAAWYYRDPRYAWALEKKQAVSGRVSMGEYNCLPTVEAAAGSGLKPPADLLGTKAWPLDPYYYKTFGGPQVQSLEQSVDKVVFRNGFDPQDQYLLLDGLSNGGHKHLDGNSISRWSEKGRIWLADADYILAAPKYHNGVLIFRDGQSQQIPDFCEIEHNVDFSQFGGTTTTFRNYAGVDWRRHILWLKGNSFLVADEMVAKEDGDYSFRVVWNTVGEVSLMGPGLNIHQDGQYASIAVSPDCRLLLDNDPDYGKNWSGYKYIKEPVVRVFKAVRDCKLKAGERTVIYSLLTATGDKQVMPRLVPFADRWVAVDGLADPIVAGVGGVHWEMHGLGVPEVDADDIVYTPSRVWLVGADRIDGGEMPGDIPEGADVEYNLQGGEGKVIYPARTTTSPFFSEQPVAGPSLAEKDMRAVMREIINKAPAVQAQAAAGLKPPTALKQAWSYRERPTTYLLTANKGAQEAVDCGLKITASPEPLAANVFSGAPGQNTADKAVDGGVQGTENCVMWADDQPATLRLDLDRDYDVSKLVVKAWFVTVSSKDKKFQVGKIGAEASLDGFVGDVRSLVDFTDTAMHGNWGDPAHEPQVYEFPLKAKAKNLRLTLTPRPGTAIYLAEVEVWGDRAGLSEEIAAKPRASSLGFSAVTQADINGDGVREVLAGLPTGKLLAISATGERLWEAMLPGAINALGAVDFEGSGKPTIVAGCMGARAVALSPEGKVLWTFEAPYYKRVGHMRVVFPADLEGKGKQVAILGSDNWHFYAVDAQGKQIWAYESVHGSTCGAAADVDGDGRQEVVAGTEYYWWHVVRPDGKALFSYSTRSGPHANAATTASLDGDKTRCVVFGGADGNVHVLGPDGKLRWQFNAGDEIVSVSAADVNGDGKDEIIAGSMNFNVFAIDSTGKAVWRTDVGSEVTGTRVANTEKGPQVVVTSRDGGLYVLEGATGAVRAGQRLVPGKAILSVPETGQAKQFAVAPGNGDLLLFQLP